MHHFTLHKTPYHAVMLWIKYDKIILDCAKTFLVYISSWERSILTPLLSHYTTFRPPPPALKFNVYQRTLHCKRMYVRMTVTFIQPWYKALRSQSSSATCWVDGGVSPEIPDLATLGYPPHQDERGQMTVGCWRVGVGGCMLTFRVTCSRC